MSLFSRVIFRVLYLRKGQVIVRFSYRKGLLARRSYRASLPPTLMGLATFSLVLVLFGGVVYAAAVPALIVQNPVIQSVVESVTASRDESADAADSLSQASGSKSSSAGPVASSSSGGVSFPGVSPLTAPLGDSDASSDSLNEGSPSSTEESQGDSESGEGGSQNPVPPSDEGSGGEDSRPPVQPDPGPDPDEEASFRATLVGYYNNLAPHAQTVSNLFAQFNSNCLSADSDLRMSCFSEVNAEFNALMAAGIEVQNLAVPNGSAYAQKYEDISTLYYDLTSATAALRRAWIINVSLENPSEHQADFMDPILEKTGPDGKIIPLSDFEQRYPGACP